MHLYERCIKRTFVKNVQEQGTVLQICEITMGLIWGTKSLHIPTFKKALI